MIFSKCQQLNSSKMLKERLLAVFARFKPVLASGILFGNRNLYSLPRRTPSEEPWRWPRRSSMSSSVQIENGLGWPWDGYLSNLQCHAKQLCHTHTHTTLSCTTFHTTILSHPAVSQTTLSDTTLLYTTLSQTSHTELFHAQPFHTQLRHTHTHNIVTQSHNSVPHNYFRHKSVTIFSESACEGFSVKKQPF